MTRKRPSFSRRGEQATQANQEAAIADAIPRIEVGDDLAYADQARFARAQAELYLKPMEPVAVSAGEAVTWENKVDEPYLGAHARIVDTLEHPNSISVGASIDRTSAALGAGVLEPAVDAAVSIQAANSLEKMLAHQMAGAHFSAMRLLERANGDRLPAADVLRFTNAAARMMDAYQAAFLTLQKVKTGGTQLVVVQHVHVNARGFAADFPSDSQTRLICLECRDSQSFPVRSARAGDRGSTPPARERLKGRPDRPAMQTGEASGGSFGNWLTR